MRRVAQRSANVLREGAEGTAGQGSLREGDQGLRFETRPGGER